MPALQIRLVREREDDLALSKEERQLLRDSEQALRTQRKTVVTAGIVAALVCAISGVAARYGYLTTHRFIESRDTELVEVVRGQRTGRRFEEIRVHGGSPARSWLDKRLGFPTFLYETDFELNEVDPARRDALKVGQLFGRRIDPESEIVGMLRPTDRARFLLTSGRTAEAIKLLIALYDDASVDQLALERLTVLAGFSGVNDMTLAQAAVRHAFRPTAPPGGLFGPGDPTMLLRNLGDGHGRTLLAQYLGNARTRPRAVEFIGRLGDPRGAPLVRPFLEVTELSDRSVMGVQPMAVRALNGLDDCSATGAMRQFVLDPDGYLFAKVDALGYLNRCRGVDLKTLEQIGRTISRPSSLDAPMTSPFGLQITVRTMYEMFGASALSSIRRVVAAAPAPSAPLAMAAVPDPAVLPDLRAMLAATQAETRAQVAMILAARGDPSGLPAAVQIVEDQTQKSETRAQALRAFGYFKGPAIRRLVSNAAMTAKEPDVRTAALFALRWYDDDDTLSILFKALGDSDRTVREAAVAAFSFTPAARATAWVGDKQRDASVRLRIYISRVLQRSHPGSHVANYRGLLVAADSSVDYPAVAEAIVGLRSAYLTEPLATVIEGLSDPLREVRLAATQALVDHRDRGQADALLRNAEGLTTMAGAVRKARWAAGVASRVDASLDEVRQSLASGHLQRAAQPLASFIDFRNGYSQALKFGLSSPVAASSDRFDMMRDWHLFDETFIPRATVIRLLQAELNLRLGMLDQASRVVNGVLYQHPESRAMIRDAAQLAPLRTLYEFRLLTGLEQPIGVADPLKP